MRLISCFFDNCKNCRHKKKLKLSKGNVSGLSFIEQNNALIRFYFRCEPPSDCDEWLSLVKELEFALQFDNLRLSSRGDIKLP
jgi:hypothetical protein